MLCLVNLNKNAKGYEGNIYYNYNHYTAEGTSAQDVISELKEKFITLALEDRKKSVIPWTGIDEMGEVVDYAQTDYQVILDIDIDRELAQRYDESTKRTVTLPAWLDLLAKEAQVNFSQTLQEALIEKLGVRDRAIKKLGYTRSVRNGGIATGKYVIEVKEEL